MDADMRDRLPDLLNGRLAADERRIVEEHLLACAECRAEAALLRDMRSAMQRVPPLDASAIVAALPSYRLQPARSWGGWRIAAAITLLAAGGTSVAVLHGGANDSAASTDAVRSTTDHRAPGGVSVATRLPGHAAESPAESAAMAPIAQRPNDHAPMPARELAVAGGAVGELSDAELSALLREIESIDALPSVEVENATPLSPMPPSAPRGTDR